MESHLCAPADFIDDLLDFASDFGEGDDFKASAKTLTLPSHNTLQGIVEEDLEWITNKDAFPMVESFVDIIADNNNQSTKAKNHESPVSVLENSSTGIPAILTLPCSLKVPVKARSNIRKRRREVFGGMQWQCWVKGTRKPGRKKVPGGTRGNDIMGRKCQHCQTEKTPQWRAGPMGPKTLCNACGVRYKSGRLVPEYRPASSPTFSSKVHSNSHRKIIEMRRQMQTAGSPRVGLR